MDPRHAFLVCLAMCWSAVGFGCASSDETTVCDQAVEKYKSCNFPVTVEGGDKFNCSGALECESKCAVAATCEEMNKQQDPFQSCKNACAPK